MKGKIVLKAYLRFYILLGMMAWCSLSSAQLHIDSRVVDGKTGRALPFATVYISGNKNTISNEEGEFVIDADSADVLRISYVGYQSLYIPAWKVKSRVALAGDKRTLEEVVVMGTDHIVHQVMKRLWKDYRKHHKYQTNFFYRQVGRTGRRCTTFLESFFSGKPAVQLRDLSLVHGRYVSVVSSATLNPLNFFTFAQVPISDGDFRLYEASQLVPLVSNYKRFYRVDCQSIFDGEKRVYVLSFEPRNENQWAVKGKIYVDGETFQLLKYEGEGVKDCVGTGHTTVAHVLPATYTFVVNYQHDQGFAEVQSVYFDVSYVDGGKHYVTKGMAFNVADRFVKGKDTMRFDDNLFEKIADKGFDNDFWERNEIVKRSPLEEEAKNIIERDNLIGVY